MKNLQTHSSLELQVTIDELLNSPRTQFEFINVVFLLLKFLQTFIRKRNTFQIDAVMWQSFELPWHR